MKAVAVPSRVERLREYLRDLWNRREFAVALGLGNLKARNASTALGLFWWIINPLLLGGVYFLIFGILFGGRRPPDFLVYLLSGMFAFHFTSQALTGGANSIISNAKLLANLRFPRLLLPISSLFEATAGFVSSLLVLGLIAAVTGQGTVTPLLLCLPLVITIHFGFNLGLGALTARLAVPFRDISNLLPYVVRIWLYLSPVIWPLSFIDNAADWVKTAVELNPMFHMISLYRAVLLGYPLQAESIFWAVAWSLVVGVAGVAMFVKYESRMVRYL